MLNKYHIGDNVEYQIEGKSLQGRVHEIKAQTKRYNSTQERKEGFSLILEDQPIGYKILGSTYRIQEKHITKKLEN